MMQSSICQKDAFYYAPASQECHPLHKNWAEPRYCTLPSQAVQRPKVLLQRKASVELRHPSGPKWSFFGGLEASTFGVKAIGAIEGNRWVQLPDIPQLIAHWELQQAYRSDVTNNDEHGNGAAIARPNDSWQIWHERKVNRTSSWKPKAFVHLTAFKASSTPRLSKTFQLRARWESGLPLQGKGP